ncbi:MAG: helix-turn-helix transcriptional regulator [Firmicutes bacterium]|nr:helix-turn-helix transcriptional regulator [Bacillota bacterium]
MKRDKLIEMRSTRGWTQKQTVRFLKEKENVDITVSFYGMIERGERNPTLKLAKSIANIFEINVEKLFFSKTDNNMLNMNNSDQNCA